MSKARIQFHLLFLLLFATLALAGQNDFHEQQGLLIQVRTLEASKPFTANPRRAPRISVPDELRDLAPRLNEFHFANFALVDSQRQAAKYGEQGELRLHDGHSLTFKPSYRGKDRVCMWMQWRDSSGMEVLNTRMNLKPGEAVLTGVDTTDKTGMVLAIDVTPVQ